MYKPIRIPLNGDNSYIPPISTRTFLIGLLNPEQLESLKEFEAKQQEAEEQEAREYERQRAGEAYNQVKNILDMVNEHPFVKELITGRLESKKAQWMRTVLPAVIRAHPNLASAEELVKIAEDIALNVINLPE